MADDQKTETKQENGNTKSDTYKVEHDPVTDVLTGGKGTKGERISTTETKKEDAA